MNSKKLDNALTEFFKSPGGQTIIYEAFAAAITDFFKSLNGQELFYESVNKAMTKEMEFEKAKDENNNPIVPPKRKVEAVNVIDQLVIYLSRTEGALQGVQSSINKRAKEIKALTAEFKQEQKRIAAAYYILANQLKMIDFDGQQKEVVSIEHAVEND